MKSEMMKHQYLNTMGLWKLFLVDTEFITQFPPWLWNDVVKIRKRKSYKIWMEFLTGESSTAKEKTITVSYTPHQCMKLHRLMNRLMTYGHPDRAQKSWESLVTAIMDYTDMINNVDREYDEVTGFMTRVKDGGIDNGWKIS